MSTTNSCRRRCRRHRLPGADAGLQSTTKYINGHSDVVGGAVVAATAELHEQLLWWANALGITGSPFDSFLTLRGLRTLDARLRVHQENALLIAERAQAHAAVSQVYFPGLPCHPGHAPAARQQRGFGAMLSVELRGGEPAVRAFVEGLRCFTLQNRSARGELVAHPATMTPPRVAEAGARPDRRRARRLRRHRSHRRPASRPRCALTRAEQAAA